MFLRSSRISVYIIVHSLFGGRPCDLRDLPQPGIEPGPAVKVPNLNHLSARDSLNSLFHLIAE